jgi:hypothetical protein
MNVVMLLSGSGMSVRKCAAISLERRAKLR